MIEILAILALVAILTIGALWGYRKLLDNHHANMILSDVNVYHVTLDTMREKFDEEGYALPTDFRPESPVYEYDARDTSEGYWFITVEKVPGRICQLLLGKAKIEGTNYLVGEYVMGFTDDEKLFKLYKGDLNECKEEDNVMVFLVGKNICDGECPEETFCHYGQCCTEERTCGENCCGEDQSCCNGQCVSKVECPDNQVYDKNACGCVCAQDYAGMQLISDGNGGCKCPQDSTGKQLVLKNGSCACSDAGFSLVGGKCGRMDCRNGTTGNTFLCYIDNILCGYNCDSNGNNCATGICHAENCPEGEIFVHKKMPVKSYYYGCQHNVKDDYVCFRYKEKTVATPTYYCYKDEEYCCDTTNKTTFECMNGLCGDENECAAFKDSAGNGASLLGAQGLCRFEKDDYECYKVGDKWNCFNNFNLCGKNCTDPTNCGTCKTQKACNAGWTYNETSKRCENETSYCVPRSRGTGMYVFDCYSKTDDSKCGEYTSSFSNGVYWYTGSCIDPGCSSYQYEGQQMSYGEVSTGRWGCVSDKMKCSGANSTTTATCLYNGGSCGEACDFTGRNCQRVYKPECAEPGHCPQNGFDVTNNPCTCDGAVSSGLVKVKDANGNEIETYHDFCCPAGHTYTNGGCTLL